MTITLHQFPYSHFNEKARWALDFKGVAHQREGYLPGPHRAGISKLSGQAQTPVLQWEDDIVPGSADIIDYLEHKVPSPALYPADPALRDEALARCRQFDTELGPATRSLIFSGLIREAAYTANMFSTGKPSMTRRLYRWTFPLVKPLIARANGVNPDNLRRAREVTTRTMDEIADITASRSYLVGDAFSVADLTAAALLAPIASVDHPDMSRPRPVPAEVQSIIDEFADHPAVAWTNRMYREHRPR